jgi:LDH2 family malate/lactate/ureidoglycolate dehydrogenase
VDPSNMSRYRATDLIEFTAALFTASGMPEDRSRVVGEILVEADLMGHDTHGLQLAPRYLDQLASGRIAVTGDPEVVSDRQAAIVWDGRGLSGVWLAAAAVDLASDRARQFGTAVVAIRYARHVACLGAYLQRATARGQMVMIASSAPAMSRVAPFGGLDPIFSPDPIAIGIPTESDPILVDMSTSITTNYMTARLLASGGRYPGKWVQDREGNASDDPSVLFGETPGSMLPAGGHDHGQKGYGLALTVEALGQGLSGFGRAENADRLDIALFVQVFEPEAFAGFSAFSRQTAALVARCKASRPAPNVAEVRLPGERALARKRAQLRDGVELVPGTIESLAACAERLGVVLPQGVPSAST